jgi:uncharacterized membrane protein
MHWLPLAFLSSITAVLVAIFGKLGLKGIDPTLATIAVPRSSTIGS